MSNLVQLLESVINRDSFLEFVLALSEDCTQAIERERKAPPASRGYGSFGWQNTDIPSYLECCVAGCRAQIPETTILDSPSWRDLAEFLYLGKIYE